MACHGIGATAESNQARIHAAEEVMLESVELVDGKSLAGLVRSIGEIRVASQLCVELFTDGFGALRFERWTGSDAGFTGFICRTR